MTKKTKRNKVLPSQHQTTVFPVPVSVLLKSPPEINICTAWSDILSQFYFIFIFWFDMQQSYELNMTKAQTFRACIIMWQRAREYVGLPNDNNRFDFSLKRWKGKLSACWILQWLSELLEVVMRASLHRASGLRMVFIVRALSIIYSACWREGTLLPSKLRCPFGEDLYIQSNSEDNVNNWEFNEAFMDHCDILASTSERSSVPVHVDHIL